jgi:hypothetical protein
MAIKYQQYFTLVVIYSCYLFTALPTGVNVSHFMCGTYGRKKIS